MKKIFLLCKDRPYALVIVFHVVNDKKDPPRKFELELKSYCKKLVVDLFNVGNVATRRVYSGPPFFPMRDLWM